MSRAIIDNRSLTRRSRNERGSFVFIAEFFATSGAVVERAGKLGKNAPEDGGMAA
jgi:hypothetical protein